MYFIAHFPNYFILLFELPMLSKIQVSIFLFSRCNPTPFAPKYLYLLNHFCLNFRMTFVISKSVLLHVQCHFNLLYCFIIIFVDLKIYHSTSRNNWQFSIWYVQQLWKQPNGVEWAWKSNLIDKLQTVTSSVCIL